ncbi:hypothetical protein SAMN06296952_2328 [Oscillospiraceae bacterium]|nr:hypothetical protein SAMN06296952_2328 [Oscillospiraceae bacterium]
MRNGVRAVSILLVAAMVSVLMTGCSLFGGKTRTAITEVVTAYTDAVMSFDVDTQTKNMEPGHNAVSSIEMPSLQREIYDAVMASSTYEIRNIEGSEKEGTGTCDVAFQMPDLAVVTGTDAAGGYSKDELVSAISSSTSRKEVVLTLDLVFEFDSWLIKATSTMDTATFILSVGEGIEVKAISDAEATTITEEFIGYLKDADLESASSVYTDPAGTIFDQDLQDTLPEGFPDSVADLYSAVFSDYDYEITVCALDDTSVQVTLSGTAPDVRGASEAMASDPEAMVAIYSDIILSAVNETVFDPSILYDELKGHLDGSGEFTIGFIVTVDEDGNKTIAFDNESDGAALLNRPDSIIYETDGSEYISAAALHLLEDGSITEAQYSDVTGIFSQSTEDGIAVTYTGSDDLYEFAYERNETGILVRVSTWGFYEEGTEFSYDLLREQEGAEPELVNGTAGIPEGSSDDMFFTIELTEEQIAEGGTYTVTVYEQDGETVLVNAVFTIPRTIEEEEVPEEEAAEGETEGETSEETEVTDETTEETAESTEGGV